MMMRGPSAAKVQAPCMITVKWLIERGACRQGVLRFIDRFGYEVVLSQENFAKFPRDDQVWFREQVLVLPWEGSTTITAKDWDRNWQMLSHITRPRGRDKSSPDE